VDTLAYTNRLRGLPPEQKLLFACGTLLIALLGHPLVQAGVFLWMSGWIVAYARIPLKTYGGLLSVIIAFLMMSLPALCVSWAPTRQMPAAVADVWAEIHLGAYTIYLSRTGVAQALQVAVRAAAAVSCLSFVLLTVPFAELLQVMRRMRVPPLLTELLLVMYRFVFVLLETAEQIWIAQVSRGGYRGFRQGMSDLGRLIVKLLVRTNERVQQLSMGLSARGFTGQLQVVSAVGYQPSRRYAVEAMAGWLLLLSLEWWLRTHGG
jgi:cobalt/nickel transport system permease protein